MQINSLPHQELRYLTSRSAVLAAGAHLQASASGPCDGTEIHADFCFSFHQLWILVTHGKGSKIRKHPQVCVHMMMVSPLVYCAPVAKEAREETLKLEGAKSVKEKFEPLKVALGNILALRANHKVRLRCLAHNRHFYTIFRKLPQWGTRFQTSSRV